MKLIVLAAGYATRLYPLTLNRPKPLLTVAGKPIIELVLSSLASIEEIDDIYVATNARFSEHFRRWVDTYQVNHVRPCVTIVNDGSTDESNKLGALGDLDLVLRRQQIDDDIIVVAGDNLFTNNLADFAEFSRRRNAPVLAVYDVGDLTEVRKFNAIEVNEDERITFFEEKPANPKSTLTGIALYYYPRACLPLIQQYTEQGNNLDQPGHLVQWLYKRTPVYIWEVPGVWYDIGSKQTLEEANRIFALQTPDQEEFPAS